MVWTRCKIARRRPYIDPQCGVSEWWTPSCRPWTAGVPTEPCTASSNISTGFSPPCVRSVRVSQPVVTPVRRSAATSTSASALDPIRQLSHLVVRHPTFAHLLADLSLRVHHRGVVPTAEQLSDPRQRQVRQLPAQVHRDLPGVGQQPGPGGTAQVVHRDAEVLCGGGHDRRSRDLRATLRPVSYTHLRAHETPEHLVCRLL